MKVFIVHSARDKKAVQLIENLVSEIKPFEPLVLENKKPAGTIFDKFIKNAEQCQKAIVIYSGRDMGGPNAKNLKKRARENVVLELGYFIGRVGIDNTLILLSKNIKRKDFPSDLGGVEVVPLKVKNLDTKIKQFLEQ